MRTKHQPIAAGVLLAGGLLCALRAAEPEGTRRHFPELGFSMLVPSNTCAVKESFSVGPLPDMSQKLGLVSVSSNRVLFGILRTNSAYAKNGSGGAYMMHFEVLLLTKPEFENRLAGTYRYRGTLQMEMATYRTNSTVVRARLVRRDFTRPDGSILSGFGLLDFRNVNPVPEDVEFMKSVLDSITVDPERKPNKRPGADAGWRVLFAFGRPRPRTAQAER